MLTGHELATWCIEGGVSFVTGVPDSVLQGFCKALASDRCRMKHVVASDEGEAIALAIGWHLATGSIPLVYLQNSGLGHAVNPLASLVSSQVFNIPLLLLIGWRGAPGEADAAQHRLIGAATESILRSLDIPCSVLSNQNEHARSTVLKELAEVQSTGRARAVLVRRDTILAEPGCVGPLSSKRWIGSEAMVELCSYIPDDDICISTAGFISRSLAECRRKQDKPGTSDLFVVGGMGLASQVALGIALAAKETRIWCLDGDGALLMHLGSSATIGFSKAPNLFHVVFNNGVHESVGGFRTSNPDTDFAAISVACGYRAAASVSGPTELRVLNSWIEKKEGPYFLELSVDINDRQLSRPQLSPSQNKLAFADSISKHQRRACL